MLIYIVVPHDSKLKDFSFFTSYSAMEQFVLNFARVQKRRPSTIDWCEIYAYSGEDELQPVFKYTVQSNLTLTRTTL